MSPSLAKLSMKAGNVPVFLPLVSPGSGLEPGSYWTLDNYFLDDVWMDKWENGNGEKWIFTSLELLVCSYLILSSSGTIIRNPSQESPESSSVD